MDSSRGEWHPLDFNQLFLMPDSRSQYESKLKQWKMIKNLTQKEWQLVIGHLNERRRQGKENSVVSLHDRRIPNAKLRKAVQRYSIPTLHDRFFGPCKLCGEF